MCLTVSEWDAAYRPPLSAGVLPKGRTLGRAVAEVSCHGEVDSIAGARRYPGEGVRCSGLLTARPR